MWTTSALTALHVTLDFNGGAWKTGSTEVSVFLAGLAGTLENLAVLAAWVFQEEGVEGHALAASLFNAGLGGGSEVESDDGHLWDGHQTFVVCDGGGDDGDLAFFQLLGDVGEGHDWAVAAGDAESSGDLLGEVGLSEVLGGVVEGGLDGSEVEVLGLWSLADCVSLQFMSLVVDGHITRSEVEWVFPFLSGKCSWCRDIARNNVKCSSCQNIEMHIYNLTIFLHL